MDRIEEFWKKLKEEGVDWKRLEEETRKTMEEDAGED
jgi:hypothetical protein